MTWTTCTILAMLSLALTPLAGSSDAERLHALFEQHHEWQLREFPERALARGDERFADRVTDQSLRAIERRHRETVAMRERLDTIDFDALDDSDRINYELFELSLRRSIEGHDHRDFLAPVSGRTGPHQRIAQMADRVPFRNATDYENYLARLEQVPRMIDDFIARMRIGLEEGRTPPRVVLQGIPAQFDALLEGGGLAALRQPLSRMPGSIPQEQRDSIQRRFREQIKPDVRAAIERFGAFMVEAYLPGCREAIAAADWPDGEAYYDHQLWVMTTTDMTAREIHEIGLSEVARIRAEMMEVIRRSDFLELHPEKSALDEEALFGAFVKYLRTDERFYFDDPEALLAEYRNICKIVDGHMPALFRTLPRLPYTVKEIPRFMAPTQTTAYYQSGSLEAGQPGVFYANTYRLDQRPKYEMIALAIHEAVPGHHHQIAIAQELEDIPEFRRDTWFTAYGEGWALYSERLGIEMGMYEDPYDDFGRLLYEMWRACRLVVDPGMHALGWTREEAIDFMNENTALSELNIVTEVDRYIAWPGQATAYKIGELKIRELRERAESRLGERFDLREFHDVVLLAGAIPLPVLERRVNEWIDSVSR